MRRTDSEILAEAAKATGRSPRALLLAALLLAVAAAQTVHWAVFRTPEAPEPAQAPVPGRAAASSLASRLPRTQSAAAAARDGTPALYVADDDEAAQALLGDAAGWAACGCRAAASPADAAVAVVSAGRAPPAGFAGRVWTVPGTAAAQYASLCAVAVPWERLQASSAPDAPDGSVAALVSDCSGRGAAASLARGLEKAGARVDTYGACPGALPVPAAGLASVLGRYTFVVAASDRGDTAEARRLAWAALEAGAVPLYAGEGAPSGWLPARAAAVDTSRVRSAAQLAAYLRYLAGRPEAMATYHAWRDEPEPGALRLCARAGAAGPRRPACDACAHARGGPEPPRELPGAADGEADRAAAAAGASYVIPTGSEGQSRAVPRRDSHSQFGQDTWLERNIFAPLGVRDAEATFLEVGCYDGVTNSNSLRFASRGWQGLCVEANPQLYPYARRNRDTLTLQYCLASKESELQFLTFGGIGGLKETMSDSHARRVDGERRKSATWKAREITVPCVPLQGVFDTYEIRSVDLMSVDVEGAEWEVLKGVDFSRTRVTAIVVEDNYRAYGDTVEPWLAERGFRVVHREHPDVFYLRNDIPFPVVA